MWKKVTLTRKQYKSVKKMDHNDMDSWVASIYESGYNDGRNSVPGIDFEEAKEVLLSIKGIGEKKAAVIIESLDGILAKKVESTQKEC